MSTYVKRYLKINFLFGFFIYVCIQTGFAQNGPEDPIPFLIDSCWYARRLEVLFPIEEQKLYTFKDFKKIVQNNLMIEDSAEKYYLNWSDASRGPDIRIRIWQHPSDMREYKYLKKDSDKNSFWFVRYNGLMQKPKDEKLILRRKSNTAN